MQNPALSVQWAISTGRYWQAAAALRNPDLSQPQRELLMSFGSAVCADLQRLQAEAAAAATTTSANRKFCRAYFG